MLPDAFIYWKINFPSLTMAQIQAAVLYVEANWYGVLTMWSTLPALLRDKKRVSLECLLVAWYLSNVYPQYLIGVVSNGGLPLSSKSIGNVSVQFLAIECQESLKPLLSNTFGLQALQIITSSPDRFAIYG